MTDDARSAAQLTDEAYWDRYWGPLVLPAVVRRTAGDLYLSAILDVLDRYLPHGPGSSVLEVGGAPGQYLAYLHSQSGCGCSCLDYSSLGCARTRQNFELLGIPGVVHEGSLFDESLDLPRFDMVYSLGLVEHFASLRPVIAAHARLVRPGGVLVLGAPNFRGINGRILRRLRPEALEGIGLESMDLSRWPESDAALGIEPVFKGYVGGFEPSILRPRRPVTGAARLSARALWAADLLMHNRLRVLRRLNGPALSGYLFGVYRVECID